MSTARQRTGWTATSSRTLRIVQALGISPQSRRAARDFLTHAHENRQQAITAASVRDFAHVDSRTLAALRELARGLYGRGLLPPRVLKDILDIQGKRSEKDLTR